MIFFEDAIQRKISKKKESKNNSLNNFVEYIRFLADLGKLDELFLSFKIYDKDFIKSNESYLNKNKVFIRIEKLLENILIDNKYNLKDVILKKKSIDELIPCLFEVSLNDDSHEYNLFLSYILNKVIFEKKLSIDLGTKLIDYFWHAENCNPYRKDYCIFSISQYFFKNDIFFKLKDKFYNHIQKIYSRINESTLIDSEEKSTLIYYINSQLRNSNTIKSEKNHKFAICISGIYRNHSSSLVSIIKNIAEPLNADVYIHTWDKNSVWSGFGGSPIAHRIFEKEISDCVPKDIYFNLNNLSKFMPNTYNLIKNPKFIDLDINEIKSILKPRGIIVEDQNEIHNKIKSDENFNKLRGSLNQIKMFYGIKKSIDLALENDNYDYIVRLRPDVFISNKINTSSFMNLEKNTIYTSFGDYGLGDFEFVISSSMAFNLSSFINDMFVYDKLSLYTQFPLYDSHNLLLLWMVENDYKYSPSLNSRYLLKSDLSKCHIDTIEQEILNDFSNMSMEDKLRFESFIFALQNRLLGCE